VIKYLGSKRAMLDVIADAVAGLRGVERAVDLFSGSARVAHRLKALGLQVLANDDAAYAAVLARCYVEADLETHGRAAAQLVDEFARLPGEDGYVTRTFCEAGRFFQPHNGRRIDRIRRAIAEKALEPVLEAVLLTSLVEAADRVDSTTGVHMAYLKDWSPRSYKDLELRVPALLPRARHGAGRALCGDALALAPTLDADVVYLDPPYNQHRYCGNYHLWETLVRNDAPETFGVAMKRVDCRARKSPFNSRRTCEAALFELLGLVRARHVVLSFSNEGFVDLARLRGRLAELGRVREHVTERPRYVGARIGIHDAHGKRVGTVAHTTNREHLFVVTRAR
jgi:adenine-specific DNA-methyltransferase